MVCFCPGYDDSLTWCHSEQIKKYDRSSLRNTYIIPLNFCCSVVCLFCHGFLATCKVMSGWVPTSDSTHSWQPYRVVAMGDLTTDTIT